MMSRGGGSTEGQPRGGRVSRILSFLNKLSKVETSTAAVRQSPFPNYGSGTRLLKTPPLNTLSVTTLAWRPRPFPHAKKERFSGRRAWYQLTNVMFLVNDSVDNEFHYVVKSVYFEVHNCTQC